MPPRTFATQARMSRQEGRAYFIGAAPKSRSRYRVAPKEQRTVDGRVFDSLVEAKHYAELKLRERLGELSDLRCQVEFVCVIKGREICKYHLDFAFLDKHGKQHFVEVKSAATRKERDWPLRRKLVEALFGITITEVVR